MPAPPYADVLNHRDPLAVIAETPARLAVVLAGISTEEADLRPAPGKWCLREIIAHLADCEIAWSWRLRQVLAEDNAVLAPFDQDAWSRIYGAYSLEAAWATYKALRAWNVSFLRALSEAERSKPYTHPTRGPETLWTIAQIMAGHDLHHLATLEKPLANL